MPGDGLRGSHFLGHEPCAKTLSDKKWSRAVDLDRTKRAKAVYESPQIIVHVVQLSQANDTVVTSFLARVEECVGCIPQLAKFSQDWR